MDVVEVIQTFGWSCPTRCVMGSFSTTSIRQSSSPFRIFRITISSGSRYSVLPIFTVTVFVRTTKPLRTTSGKIHTKITHNSRIFFPPQNTAITAAAVSHYFLALTNARYPLTNNHVNSIRSSGSISNRIKDRKKHVSPSFLHILSGLGATPPLFPLNEPFQAILLMQPGGSENNQTSL